MNIFVAKLNSGTTAGHLTELFSQFGKVSSTKVIMDRETGMSKCYGFVEMEDEEEGASAITNLNGTNFMGNCIVVKKSEPRSQEKRSNDRRFGGGRRSDSNRRFDNRREEGDRRPFYRDRGSNKYEG